jgi:hypothetical protein
LLLFVSSLVFVRGVGCFSSLIFFFSEEFYLTRLFQRVFVSDLSKYSSLCACVCACKAETNT